MKQTKILFLSLILLVFLSSCKTYNYNNHKPTPKNKESEKLAGLVLVSPMDDLKKQLAPTIYSVDRDLLVEEILKIHNDGLQSICSDSIREKYGYYTFNVSNQKHIMGGKGYYVSSILTLGVGGLLGLPWWNLQTQMDLDFFIYDAKKNLVAKYKINVIPNQSKAWIACYWGYSEKNSYFVSNAKAHKFAFEEFSRLVAKDVKAINAKLLSGGTVEIEKSDVIGNSNETTIILDPNKEINKEKGGGTGFLISEKGYVVTNYHVIKDARDIKLYFQTDSNKTTEYKASVVRSDKVNDIAVLKIKGNFISAGKIPYSFTDEYDVSNEVYTIGYPQPDIMGASYKYTKGEISSLSGIENNITMMQITTPIQPGNSGGALFNTKGEIVGITTSTLNPFYIARYQGNIPQNVNYAVKADYVKPLVKQYLDKDRASVSNLPRAEQIKELSKFICMIRTY